MTKMDYIRERYKVPAKRGGRIIYKGCLGGDRAGIITGSSYGRLRIRLNGEKISLYYHPTWKIEYLERN